MVLEQSKTGKFEEMKSYIGMKPYKPLFQSYIFSQGQIKISDAGAGVRELSHCLKHSHSLSQNSNPVPC